MALAVVMRDVRQHRGSVSSHTLSGPSPPLGAAQGAGSADRRFSARRARWERFSAPGRVEDPTREGVFVVPWRPAAPVDTFSQSASRFISPATAENVRTCDARLPCDPGTRRQATTLALSITAKDPDGTIAKAAERWERSAAIAILLRSRVGASVKYFTPRRGWLG